MTEQLLIALIGAIFASTGLWTLILYLLQRHDEKKKSKQNDNEDIKKTLEASNQMILGLGHETIVELGLKYLQRGEITDVQYDDLIKYLYKPYQALGGNGTAEKIIEDVKKLPIVPSNKLGEE